MSSSLIDLNPIKGLDFFSLFHAHSKTKCCPSVLLFLIMIVLLFLITVYHMRQDGWIKVSQTDVAKLHYQYQEEKQNL